jgi:hypothetical protein
LFLGGSSSTGTAPGEVYERNTQINCTNADHRIPRVTREAGT